MNPRGRKGGQGSEGLGPGLPASKEMPVGSARKQTWMEKGSPVGVKREVGFEEPCSFLGPCESGAAVATNDTAWKASSNWPLPELQRGAAGPGRPDLTRCWFLGGLTSRGSVRLASHQRIQPAFPGSRKGLEQRPRRPECSAQAPWLCPSRGSLPWYTEAGAAGGEDGESGP